MDIYIKYFSLLGGTYGSIFAIIGWVLAGIIASWLIGAWIVVFLIPKTSENSTPGLSNEWLWLHPAIIATGWATLITTSKYTLWQRVETVP